MTRVTAVFLICIGTAIGQIGTATFSGRVTDPSGGIWNAIFGGYDLAWIQMVESGLPLSFTFANSPNNYYPAFAGVRRPNVTGSPALRSNWGDFGGDRFNQANINAVIPMSYFSYPAAEEFQNPGEDESAASAG